MQLINSKIRRLIPLTVTGGLLASAFAFSYGSFDNNMIKNIVSSPSIDNLMKQSNDPYYTQHSMKTLFNQRLSAWKKNTMFYSFADQIVKEKNFMEIVSLGEEVVPYILEEINERPSPLVWALNIIFDRTISNNHNISIEQACKLWAKALMQKN